MKEDFVLLNKNNKIKTIQRKKEALLIKKEKNIKKTKI